MCEEYEQMLLNKMVKTNFAVIQHSITCVHFKWHCIISLKNIWQAFTKV